MNTRAAKIKNEIEILSFCGVYYFGSEENICYVTENHDFWELIYIDKGEISVTYGDTGTKIHQGQAVFVPPKLKHSHISSGGKNNVLVIAFSCKSEIIKQFIGRVFTITENEFSVLLRFLSSGELAMVSIPNKFEDRYLADFSNAMRGSTQLMQCQLTELLLTIFYDFDACSAEILSCENARKALKRVLIEQIITYFNENLKVAITLEQICEQFMVNRTYLLKIFKQETGTSPINYFINLKINEAKRLVREGKLNVSAIAKKLGYQSANHFSHMFLMHTSYSPTKYSKLVIKNDEEYQIKLF